MEDKDIHLKKHYDYLVRMHKKISREMETGADSCNYAELKNNLDQIEQKIKMFREQHKVPVNAQNNSFGLLGDEMLRPVSGSSRYPADFSIYGAERENSLKHPSFLGKSVSYKDTSGLDGPHMQQSVDNNSSARTKYNYDGMNTTELSNNMPQTVPFVHDMHRNYVKTEYDMYTNNFSDNTARMNSYTPEKQGSAHSQFNYGFPPTNYFFSPEKDEQMASKNAPMSSNPNMQSHEINLSKKSPHNRFGRGITSPIYSQMKQQYFEYPNTAAHVNDPIYSPYHGLSAATANNNTTPGRRPVGHPDPKKTKIAGSCTLPNEDKNIVMDNDIHGETDPTFLLSFCRLPDVNELCFNAKHLRSNGLHTNLEYFMKKWNLKFEITDSLKEEILDSCDQFFSQLCKKSINIARNTENKTVKRKHIELAFYKLKNYHLPNSTFIVKNKAFYKKKCKK